MLAHSAKKGLGFAPKSMVIRYPAGSHGEIYIPALNTALWIACFTLVVVFQKSSNLASAYGLAVTGAMLVDSFLLFPVFVYLWSWGPVSAALATLPFFVIDSVFFAAGEASETPNL